VVNIALTCTKQADLFLVCSRSADISVADLQSVYRSTTDYLQILCRMSAEYLIIIMIIIIIIIMVYLQYSNRREALTTVNVIFTIKK